MSMPALAAADRSDQNDTRDAAEYVPTEADGALYDNAPADVPEWVDEQPCALRGFLVFLFFGALRKGDSVDVVLRKIVTSVGFLLGIHRIVAPLAEIPAADSIGEWIHIVSLELRGMFFVACFVCVKRWPSKQGPIIDVVQLLSCVTLIASVLTHVDHAGGASVAMLQLLLAALALNNTFNKAMLTLCFLAAALQYYNRASYTTHKIDGAPMDFLLPGAVTELTFRRNLVDYAGALFTWLGVIIIISVQINEAKRRNAAAQAAIALAESVARAVGAYDTSGAAALIDQARVDGVAEPKLLDTFAHITRNLESYRPHLPNWVIDSQRAVVDRRADAPDTELDTASTRGNEMRSRSGSVNSESSRGSVSSVAMPYRAAAASMRPRAGTHAATMGLSSLTTTLTGAATDAVRCWCAFAELHFSVPDAAEIQEQLRADLANPRAVSGTRARELMANALHNFVDRTYTVARSTGAAVHSFVGDSVRVTWNVAAPVAQPEAKAARFLVQMRENNGDPDIVRVYGCAATATARVQLSGKKASTALTMSILEGPPSWKSALASASCLARRYNAFVATGHVFVAARHAVVFRGVGVAHGHGDPIHSACGGELVEQTSGGSFLTRTSSIQTTMSQRGGGGGGSFDQGRLPQQHDDPLHRQLYEALRECVTDEDAWLYTAAKPGASRTSDGAELSPDAQHDQQPQRLASAPPPLHLDEVGAELLCRAAERLSCGDHASAHTFADQAQEALEQQRFGAASPIVADFIASVQQHRRAGPAISLSPHSLAPPTPRVYAAASGGGGGDGSEPRGGAAAAVVLPDQD